jgi:hypothetical protein
MQSNLKETEGGHIDQEVMSWSPEVLGTFIMPQKCT